MLLEQDLQKTGMGFMVFKTYLPEFLSKLVEKLHSRYIDVVAKCAVDNQQLAKGKFQAFRY